MVVGVAAPGAVELGPAAAALLLAVDVGGSEAALHLHVNFSGEDIPHSPFLLAHKLVAGVDVPVGGDGAVFIPRPAAPQPLDDAGALVQVQHKVEEVKALPFPPPLDEKLCKPLVLGEDGGELGFGEGVGELGVGHHRLHRNLVEAAAV